METRKFAIETKHWNVVRLLSDEQLGQLFRMLFDYNLGLTVSTDDKMIETAFMFFKGQFDENKEKAEKISEIRAKAGSKGGRSRRKQMSNGDYICDCSKNSVVDCVRSQNVDVQREILSTIKSSGQTATKAPKTRNKGLMPKDFVDYDLSDKEREIYFALIAGSKQIGNNLFYRLAECFAGDVNHFLIIGALSSLQRKGKIECFERGYFYNGRIIED